MIGSARSSAETMEIDQDAGAHDIAMPRLSEVLNQACIVRWISEDGQRVREGDVLAEVNASHVTMEIEAHRDGVLSVLAQAGPQIIAAGTPIGRILIEIVEQDAAGGLPLPAADPIEAQAAEKIEMDIAGQSTVELSLADAMRSSLACMMRRDGNVFVIGESVADFGRCSPVVRGLAEEFGSRRVVGTPITPHAVVGLAVGAAMAGLKPVVEVTAWALALQAIDPIVSTAAKTRYRSGGIQGVPIVLRGRNGAWQGAGAMHNVSLASWFASVPGLKVVCPATSACASGLMRSAILDPDPVVILESEELYDSIGLVPISEDWIVPIGRARIAKSGDDVSIVTFGRGVMTAIDAAAVLEQEGVSAEIIDLRTLRPLDTATIIASVRKTGRLLTLDEGWPACSIGAEVCSVVTSAAFAALKAAPVRMDGADTPVPYAANLEALVFPDSADVAAIALRLVHSASV